MWKFISKRLMSTNIIKIGLIFQQSKSLKEKMISESIHKVMREGNGMYTQKMRHD